ncbi:MAG: FixH family protein [Candidatus Promineofilum sp.]|nr:FixH family protein [Promineifilum sp.]
MRPRKSPATSAGRARTWLLLIVALMAAGLVAGCRRSAGTPPDDTIRISFVKPVFPPPSGSGQLTFRLSDENEEPIDSATLQIRGDMSHAGMTPLLAAAEGGQEGVYRVPIEWTMSGDWIVTVEAMLSDGRQATRSFNFVVSGQEATCIDEE